MELIKDGELVEDPFVDVTAEDSYPDQGALLVSLEQWQAHRDELLERNDRVGILLRSDQQPELISDDLEHFDLVALDFPVFRDGRAYSYARLLRDQYGFNGELRAVGDVLLEQLHYMHRMGFNAFKINSDEAAQQWKIAADEFSVWYQPTGDSRETAMRLRHPERT